jgi:hypothetical protein
VSDEPRYFVDHGTIHDRVTGQHVELEEAAGMLSVEPEATQRIAWGVVIELGAKLKNAESALLASESRRVEVEELLEAVELQVDLTSPDDPIGVALTRAREVNGCPNNECQIRVRCTRVPVVCRSRAALVGGKGDKP